MKTSLTTLLLVIVPTLSVSGQTQSNPVIRSRSIVRQAAEAYQKKNFSAALNLFQEAWKLRTDHPGIIYNLAVCNAQAGNSEESLRLLNLVATMGLAYSPDQDSDFVSIWKEQGFEKVKRSFELNRQPKGSSQRAFHLNDLELIAEGIAYSNADRAFFVSSVRKRKIIRVDPDGRQEDFSRPADSLWAVLGMAVDEARGLLWATTTAFPFMEGFRDDLNGRAALVQYDLKTKELIRRWVIPPDGKGHILGDLAVNRRGEVYATDGQTPAIYHITPDGRLEQFIATDEFVSLQGVAFSEDETRLYVSDYSRGIFVVDILSRRVQFMGPLPGQTLLSIDGLYRYGNSLIATQNEISPNRVVRLCLSADGNTITGLTTLSANHPYATEPTLGVVVGREFVFNGNSQWKNLTARGQVRTQAVWEPHRVMKLTLP